MQRRDTLPRLLPGVPGRSPRRVGVSPCGGGVLAYHVRQVGGPAAAGPRFFILCGHGEGGGSAAVEGLPEGVRSLGNPSVARARTWVARLAVARSAIHVRSKGP